MRRFGKVIQLKPGCLEEYKKYHANIWPELVEHMHERHMHNYSIYYRDGFLFSYFEYTGDDFEADMKQVAPHPRGQEWQRIMNAMQQPVDSAGPDEWWVDMEEVFHMD